MNFVRTALLLLLFLAGTAPADERILAYDSDIRVHADASMTVIETIRVRAEGKQIKRGIYRDFPTDYKDRFGNSYRVDFEIISVRKDGQLESFHTERLKNGIRIYIGVNNVFLQPGEYTYSLAYRTTHQLGFFDDHDELYWNVTGNGWAFPIDYASAGVTLPASIPSSEMALEGYTGGYGAKGQDYDAWINETGVAAFETTRRLAKNEGLTIVVTWPKGYFTAPSLADRVSHLLSANSHIVALLAGLALLGLYYILIWVKMGKDPPAGVIVPHYIPPKGYSPASMRFIRRMGYDHKAFAAALVNLAIKGYLTIDEDDDSFTLTKTDKEHIKMAPGEKALVRRLLRHAGVIQLTQDNHETISAAIDSHKKSLKRNYEKIYFLTNSIYLVPGVLISIVTLVAISLTLPDTTRSSEAVLMTAWLTAWTIGVVVLVKAAISAWRAVGTSGITAPIVTTVFALPFVAFEVFGFWALSNTASYVIPLVLVVLVIINVFFYYALKTPTRAGRKLLDKVEGFRNYLQVAEGQELKGRRLPRRTIDQFEIYLPYALALDVEQQWSEQFADVFAEIRNTQGNHYRPSWYHHGHGHLDVSRLTSSLGSSLGNAISSSSHAPGSSSGSGGGGFSGGGGGGGW
jgi:uncharacterized membrane protein YgcG